MWRGKNVVYAAFPYPPNCCLFPNHTITPFLTCWKWRKCCDWTLQSRQSPHGTKNAPLFHQTSPSPLTNRSNFLLSSHCENGAKREANDNTLWREISGQNRLRQFSIPYVQKRRLRWQKNLFFVRCACTARRTRWFFGRKTTKFTQDGLKFFLP